MKKLKFMIDTGKQEVPKISIKINNSSFESCDSDKYLGVAMDKKMKSESHVDQAILQIKSVSGMPHIYDNP